MKKIDKYYKVGVHWSSDRHSTGLTSYTNWYDRPEIDILEKKRYKSHKETRETLDNLFYSLDLQR
jgi:hypothetical protein